MNAMLKAWAWALGGDVAGREVLAPGPGHSRQDRSLSVRSSATSPDGFLVYSFTGDDWRLCRDHVRAKLGLPQRKDCRIRKQPYTYVKQHEYKSKQLEATRGQGAGALWRASVDPRSTIVEQYLKSRALDLPDEAANEAIRFHPNCPFRDERFPAMICLVRDIVSNEPQAIHRTALASDGTAIKRDGKTFRMSLGAIAGGAIKLDPDEDVTQGLCIGEGVETCLSGRQEGYWPVWSAISTSGIAAFPVLPAISGLHVFGERDERLQSEKAVLECADRWLAAGRDHVFAIWPDLGKDLNEEIIARKTAP
jgi:putative DNA primase/helicase